MGRSIAEIYDSLIAEKNSQSALNDLEPGVDNAQTLLSDVASGSRVADWRLWLWLFSFGIFVLEAFWDIFKTELDDKINSAPVATKLWYQKKALEFQYGDTLVWLDNKYQYAVIDPTKQIVKRASVIDGGGQVTFKVAKLVGSVVTKLSIAEKAAFTQYINMIKIAGTQSIIVTDDPDLLKIAYTVFYDPLVLASDGSLLTDGAVFPVEDAINTYISTLDFNADMILTKLTDTLQLATGVVDPVLTLAEAKFGSNPYATVNVKYNAYAGHMIVDAAFPLSTQITYTANV